MSLESIAKKLFFHGQKNRLFLQVFNANSLVGDGKIKAVITFNDRLRSSNVVSKLIPKSSYRHLYIDFNIPTSSSSDYPINNFIKIQI